MSQATFQTPSGHDAASHGGRLIRPPGYEIDASLLDGARSQVLRGHRVEDGTRVILKVLREERASAFEVARFRREYELAHRLDLPSVARARELSRVDGHHVLILEDIDGESLDRIWRRARPAPVDVMPLALSIVEALQALHERGIVHKDVNPSNIVWNRATGRVQIIDFGISSELSREEPFSRGPRELEGTLPFLAPEQTGCVNRSIDHRSDLYAFGVTLFFLVTGRLPFASEDALELVRAHVARAPPPADALDARVPRLLAAIIEKLLAKAPEDRYQTAGGLLDDLRHCHERFGDEAPYALGRTDVSPRLTIPEKLYGRANEAAQLRAACARAAAGATQIVVVSGPSGSGKSTLVRELQQDVAAARGMFLVGKLDPLKRSVPYEPFIDAFRGLVRVILAGTASEIEGWRARILLGVGDGGRVLTDVIPELEALLGPQPLLAELHPAASAYRFRHVFERFVGVCATREHPLALFIDDAQWADGASLQLIEMLCTQEHAPALLLVLAHRDLPSTGQLDAAHPLRATLDRVQSAVRIALPPLGATDLTALLVDALHAPRVEAAALGEVLVEKTAGNAFFTVALLRRLHDDGALRFDAERFRFRFDTASIARTPASAVDVVIAQLSRLPPDARRTLACAALLGPRVDAALLAEVVEAPPAVVSAHLWDALRAGFLVPLDADYRLARSTDEVLPVGYRFAHDRVQEAAHALLVEAERPRVHLRIARALQARGDKALYDVVGHLDAARAAFTTRAEHVELAELALRAALRAAHCSAFEPALRFAELGINALGEQGWATDMPLLVALHGQGAAAAEPARCPQALRAHVEAVRAHARTPLDTLDVIIAEMRSLAAHGKQTEATRCGIAFMHSLGEKLPTRVEQRHLALELWRVKRTLARIDVDGFVKARSMTDERSLALMRVMNASIASAFFTAPQLFALFALRQIRIGVRDGIHEEVAVAFTAYALALGGPMRDLEGARRFAQLAVRLVQERGYRRALARVYGVAYGLLGAWHLPVRECVPKTEEGFHAGTAIGDAEWSFHCLASRSMLLFLSTGHYGTLLAEMRAQLALMHRYDASAAHYFAAFCQGVACIGGAAPVKDVLRGDFLDDAQVHALLAGQNRIAIRAVHMVTSIVCAVQGAYEKAIAAADAALPYADHGVVAPNYMWCRMLAAMSRLALAQPGTQAARSALAATREGLGAFADAEQLCAANFAWGRALVDAERARVAGDESAAHRHYRAAIAAARTGELALLRAVCQERYARFCAALGEDEMALLHMQHAHRLFVQVGALPRAEQLERERPELTSGMSLTSSPRVPRTPSSSAGLWAATQALATELRQDALLAQFLRLALEATGAERGALLVPQGADLLVVVEGGLQEGIALRAGVPIDAWADGPITLLRTVARSLEAVVVDDSAIDLRSRRDPWVATRGARSLLAVPLLRQGALTVLVFLEHGAATHAFHAERLEALRVLGSQLVISFENARLHGELVRTNERLSAALERAAESARAKNEALTTTSHDLRAPLHALVALPAQLLREAEAGPLDECRLLDGLRTVAREGQRLSHIVDDVLDAALLEGEGLHLSRAPVDVAALLAALEAEAAPSARDAGVSLVVEPIDASKGALEVGADGERLRQVLRILVGNAVQRSGGKGTVRVRAWRVLDEVRFSVRDDGHARRPSLALSIAHKLVALHGGRIDVASDSATTCVVTLPL